MSGIVIYKFGGASVRDVSRMRNVAQIIAQYDEGPLVVVISAIGKTTNALEALLKSYRSEVRADESLWTDLVTLHTSMASSLQASAEEMNSISGILSDLKNTLGRNDLPYDQHYDLVIGYGEMLSSALLEICLVKHDVSVRLVDARSMIYTDDVHRNAKVNWELSSPEIKNTVREALETAEIALTQGFLGRTTDGVPTTLGREGSDYTGAILAYCLDAQSMTVWKDVQGVYSADPKKYDKAVLLDQISYKEAIEMSYYGAKVIHPKTIKPLENKQIPLCVRSFIEKDEVGTVISEIGPPDYPGILVREQDQTLLRISTEDLSFVAEEHLAVIFSLFDKYRIKVNAMKNTAISFVACVKDDGERSRKCVEKLKESMRVEEIDDLELITIRHGSSQMINEITADRVIYFRESYGATTQLVCNSSKS